MNSLKKTPDECALVFDLGRVLIDFDETLIVRSILEEPAMADRISSGKISAEKIYDTLFRTDLLQDLERGKITHREFFSGIQAVFQFPITYERFVEIWSSIFTEKEGTEALLVDLKNEGYTLYLLSNIDELHFQLIKKQYNLLTHFDKLFPSYELGYAKPDPEIYEAVIKYSGRPAHELFYTDDRVDLIEGGKASGLHSVVFTDLESLKQDLLEFGVGGFSSKKLS